MRHKNTIGQAAAMAVILFLVLTASRRVHPLLGWTLCTASVLVVIQAGSMTTWLTLAACLTAWWFLCARAEARQLTRVTWQKVGFALVLGISSRRWRRFSETTTLPTAGSACGKEH
jgi:hypothetical protein